MSAPPAALRQLQASVARSQGLCLAPCPHAAPSRCRQVMACPGGCIGGGGQPKTHDPEALLKRMGAIYQVEE